MLSEVTDMVSRKFKIAVKMSETPAWKIAFAAGVHPNVLSKIMSGAVRIKTDDTRVIRIGAILGLSKKECFEENRQ